MVQDLLRLKEDKLIFVDIETAALNKSLDVNSEEFGIFSWKVRNKDIDIELSPEDVIALYAKKAALYSSHSRVVCITIGFISKGSKIVLKTFVGEEKDILRNFVDTITLLNGYTLVLWNMAFDMPVIRKRFYINKLRMYLPDSIGNDSMKKPWTLKGIIDLMDVWKGISYNNENMNEVAWAMGLPLPKEDMKGSEVSEAYYAGKINEIVNYNRGDVRTLINLYRLFTEKEIITDVIIKDDVKVVSSPVLERIYVSKEISEADKSSLKTLFSGKKLSPEEREIVKTMLHGLYVNSKMFESDSDSTVKEKQKEVELLMNEIC